MKIDIPKREYPTVTVRDFGIVAEVSTFGIAAEDYPYVSTLERQITRKILLRNAADNLRALAQKIEDEIEADFG